MLSLFRKLMPREDRFFDMFARHSRTVVAAAEALDQLLSGQDIEANCRKIVDLENQADDLLDNAIINLFASSTDAIELVKLKDIYQDMEIITDKCEDAANVIESIIIKYA